MVLFETRTGGDASLTRHANTWAPEGLLDLQSFAIIPKGNALVTSQSSTTALPLRRDDAHLVRRHTYRPYLIFRCTPSPAAIIAQRSTRSCSSPNFWGGTPRLSPLTTLLSTRRTSWPRSNLLCAAPYAHASPILPVARRPEGNSRSPSGLT